MKCDHGFLGRVFSVMRRRDDLPEMTLPLAVLLIFGVSIFSSAGAKLASPVAETMQYLHFVPQNFVGAVACLPFLPLSACLFALIILLWRRFASLLATPVTFAVMLAFGVDMFTTVVISVSVLLVAYVYATSLISRENRFCRITSLTIAIALCIFLTLVAWIGLNYENFSEFTEAYMSEVPMLIGRLYSSYVNNVAGGATEIPAFYLDKMARELFVMCPAYLGVLSILLAWFTDYLACSAFKILDCEDVFIEITNKITLPFSYAVVYSSVLVMSFFTSSEYNPMLFVMLKSVLYVMLLPCAAVGVRGLMHSLEDKLYYLTREKVLAAMILVFAFAFLGISLFLLATSAIGAGVVIKEKLVKEKPDKE